MELKKRWILFGILFIILIKIFYTSALGLGTGLGGEINIPLGNQTFPNETISPDNSDDTDYIEDIDDLDSIDDYEDELEIDESEEDSDYSENPVTDITNTTTNSETQSSTASSSSTESSSSSSTNSNSFNEFVKNFIEKISPDKNIKDDEKNDEVIIESELQPNEENSIQNPAGYKGQDVKIILFINTLCLFFAFVTLRNYNKSFEES